MGLAEKGVVDFLTDTVEDGNVVVGVLGATVALDGLEALVAHAVELVQEIGLYHVVGIQNNDVVVVWLRLEVVHGILHGLGLGTLLKDGLQQGDGQLGQLLVGLRLHVVGDDSNMELVIGIVLAQAGAHGIDDDAVFVIGRIEDEKLHLPLFAECHELAFEIG